MLTTRVPCPRCGGVGGFCGACDRGDASLVNATAWIVVPWLAFAALALLTGAHLWFALAGVVWALRTRLGRALLAFALAVFAFVSVVTSH